MTPRILSELDARPVRRRRSPRPAPAVCPHHDPKLAVCDRCPGAALDPSTGWPRARRGVNPYRHCPGCRKLHDRETWGTWRGAVPLEACRDCMLARDWLARATTEPAPPAPGRWYDLGRSLGRLLRSLW